MAGAPDAHAYKKPCSEDTGLSSDAAKPLQGRSAVHASAARWDRLVVGRQPAKLFSQKWLSRVRISHPAFLKLLGLVTLPGDLTTFK